MAKAKRIWLSFSQYTISLEAGANLKSTISISNHGSVVDQFSVEVEGLDERWYTLSAFSVKLVPGGQESLALTIHPPRDSSSRAGKYPFSVKAASVENPKETAMELGTLEIQPYHEFVTELHPTQRVTRGEADFQLAIRNRGNDRETFKLTAEDEQGACQFRFEEDEVKLEPGESRNIGLWVTAKRRPKFGARKQYSFQVNVVPGWDKEAAQTVAGQVAYLAMVPRWLVRAIVPIFALTIIGIWLKWPVKEPVIGAFTASPDSIPPGDSALLHWEVKQANNISIGDIGDVEAADSLWVSPKKTKTYILIAENRRGLTKKKKRSEISLEVIYPLPEIISFEAKPKRVKNPTKGVTLSWKVEGAKKVKIEPGIGDVEAEGSKTTYPEKTTIYTLVVTNEGGDTEKVVEVVLETDQARFDKELLDTEKRMKGYIEKGKSQFNRGQYKGALQSFKVARDIYSKFKKKYGPEPGLRKLDIAAAKWIEKDSLQIKKENALKRTRGMMEGRMKSGKYLYQNNRLGEAQKDFEVCIQSYQDFQKKFGKDEELAGLSEEAQRWIKKVRRESTKEGLLKETKKAMKEHNSLGNGFLYQKREYDQAIQEFETSLESYNRFKDRFGDDPQLKALGAEAEEGLRKARRTKKFERK